MAKEPTSTRYRLTKETLRSVIQETRYQDQKAARILVAIAFLTAAATSFFAILVTSDLITAFGEHWRDFARLDCMNATEILLSQQRLPAVGLGSVCLSSYSLFVLLVAIGTFIILLAIRPTFNIPKKWSNVAGEPESVLFFAKILSMERDQWVGYHTKATDSDLMVKHIRDQIFEAHLVAEKILKKYHYSQIAVRVYLIAAAFLVVFFALGIPTLILLRFAQLVSAI